MKKHLLLGLCCLLAGFVSLQAQDAEAGKGKKSKGPKAFEEVVTEDAETDEGLFTVHKVDGKYFFEIPFDLLEEEILVVSRISGHVKGLNFGGAGMKSRPQQVSSRAQRIGEAASMTYSTREQNLSMNLAEATFLIHMY